MEFHCDLFLVLPMSYIDIVCGNNEIKMSNKILIKFGMTATFNKEEETKTGQPNEGNELLNTFDVRFCSDILLMFVYISGSF